MKNFVKRGSSLDVAAMPYTVVSGGGVKVGFFFGVAANDYASGGPGVIDLSGTFSLPKVSANTFAQGALAYWDDTTKEVTSTSTGNLLIGAVATAAGAGATSVIVRLNEAAGLLAA